jgi:hypothetical protein
VACGTRTLLGATFGPVTVGETTYAPHVFGCLRPGMVLMALFEFPHPLLRDGANLL